MLKLVVLFLECNLLIEQKDSYVKIVGLFFSLLDWDPLIFNGTLFCQIFTKLIIQF